MKTLQLTSWKVLNLKMDTSENASVDTNNGLRLNLSNALKVDDRRFSFAFKIDIIQPSLRLDFEMAFEFETDDTISDNDLNEPIVRVNSPAIAFPYVRAFVSSLTMQSGLSTVLLPSVNFAAFYEDQKKSEK